MPKKEIEKIRQEAWTEVVKELKKEYRDDKFVLGKSCLLRSGKDTAIIAYGLMIPKALEAGEILSKEGISARVINMSSIKPIDEEAVLAAAEETGVIVTAEEHSVIGGLGSAVAELLSEKNPVPVIRVGTLDRFGQSGTAEELFAEYGLLAADIAAAVKKGLALKNQKSKIKNQNDNAKLKNKRRFKKNKKFG